jgi:serine/threonine protein kinase
LDFFMAEQQATPNPAADDPQPSPPPPPASTFTASAHFLSDALEPSDDTPTVLSRRPHAALRSEEALSGVVRGQRLAHFELEGALGVGGMAAVLRARDMQLDRIVALKILPPDMATDQENVRRFHQEARAAAKLDHENIARVFYCGEDQGLHFIAFEFVEGVNLRTLLDQQGRLPARQAVDYTLQVARGLAHAVERGVVHRDIKPSNIIITPAGRAKLVDMGLARSLEPQADGALTRSGVTLGTVDYISPEQALEPRDADVRSDIYSLGCTLYHVLTGQAPVPEGTAAKKLHHHQHVPPPDPRQLNPEVPDALAGVLARMMAKDPAQRYQHPDVLVQELTILAETLGPGDDPSAHVPVFSTAYAPPAAGTRSLLGAGLAGLVLVVLFVLLVRLPTRQGPVASSALDPREANSESPTSSATTLDDGGLAAPGGENTPAQSAPPTVVAIHARQANVLAQFLRQNQGKAVEVYLADNLQVTRADLLEYEGPAFTLTREGGTPARTISLAYDGQPVKDPLAALTIRAKQATIRGVRFELDAHQAPDIQLAAVVLRGGHLTLEKCQFTQKNVLSADSGEICSIEVSGAPTQEPTLDIADCYIGSGQLALSVAGAARISAGQCAFGPQTRTLCQLRHGTTESPEQETVVRLHNCSALFPATGSGFSVEEGVHCRIEPTRCVFSRPERGEGDERAPSALLNLAGTRGGIFHYRGSENAYHNLENYLIRRDSVDDLPEILHSVSAFLKCPDVDDPKSFELDRSPWESPHPLSELTVGSPGQAFRLDLPRLHGSRDAGHVLGVERCVWGPLYPERALPPQTAREPTRLATGERIVDPSVSTPAGNVYHTLRQALEDLRPGDVVLLRHNGPLAIDPVALEKADAVVTLRPYAGYRPILTLGPTPDQEAALFRLHDGQLLLEGLEFHLAPGKKGFRSQAVVALLADGRCSFKDCVITLEETKDVPLSVVILGDPAAVMRMNPQETQQVPRVRFQNCLVRGGGDLVTVHPSRPLQLTIDNSVLALAGSALVLEAGSRESTGRGAVEVSLAKVTTYLTDHLLWLRGTREETRPSRGLVPTHVRSVTGCLFAAASGKSLIHFDGVDTEDQMRKLFFWEESQDNQYSGFVQMLDQQVNPDEMMAPLPFNQTRWEDLTQESSSRFERARFREQPPSADESLAKVVPDSFRLEPGSTPSGADLDRVAHPAEDRAARRPAGVD